MHINSNHRIFFLIAFPIFVISGCRKDENVKSAAVKPEKRIIEFFGSNNSVNRPAVIKLSKDTVYILDSDITRESGEQLIIEQGTVIKAGERNPSNPGSADPGRGSLTIRPGGVLIANGTEAEPIIFTSNTMAGSQRINWGGVIIEGKAPNNDRTATGVPTDFSCSIRFLRVEFAALTLRSVGNTSLVENVMVSYTDKNGISAFNISGGTFNAKNLVSFACSGPADYYITNGYTGKLQHLLAMRHPFFGNMGSQPQRALASLFIENNPSNPVNARPFTFPQISNLTAVGPNGQNGSVSSYADTNIRVASIVTTNSTCFSIRNSVFLGFPAKAWILDDVNTALAIVDSRSVMSYSYFHSLDTSKTLFLAQGVYPPFGSSDFKGYVLSPAFNNKLLPQIQSLLLPDIFVYNKPAFLPGVGSPLLTGANFSGDFSAAFYDKVSHVGAFGSQSWTNGWTNFTPLKTNYNFSL
ncbi:MAG: hypothetical protein H7Y27_10320 [Gemmatimonadaceae bacterium]|nr:hypothetical protein [Chitinophagaceae bacterium]